MARKSDIPHLVQLLGDANPEVHARIAAELRSFGPKLAVHLDELEGTIDPGQLNAARDVLRMNEAAGRFEREWAAWPSLPTDAMRLEGAMELVAEHQYGWRTPESLGRQLDKLASDYRAASPGPSPLALSRYLFVTRGFSGDADEYYDPLNSNLIAVIERKKGLPISLACLYILTAHRLGMDVHGCNVPNHFIARAAFQGNTYYVDCFAKGRVLTAKDTEKLYAALGVHADRVLNAPASAAAIAARVLRNLVSAYNRAGDATKSEEAAALLESLLNTEAARR